MEKMFNFISVIGGLVGGFIVSLFGGWDVMLYTILLFAILDYFTGILKAVYKKELSSAIGFKGIVKKIMVFVVIAVAYNVQRMTGDTIPLREIVIVFFICNEALSILENAAEFINIPQQLKDVLLQLRDKNAAKAEEKEESEEQDMATKDQVNAFIAKLAAIARKEYLTRDKWVLPSVCIAQAALETGWGTSGLMTKANAFFGIKAGNSWKGKVYSSKTNECYDGKTYTQITAAFRAYDSLEESVADYYNLICGSSRYAGAVNNGNAESAITAIKNGGYATSPTYIKNVMNIINSYNLTQYDTWDGENQGPANKETHGYKVGDKVRVIDNITYNGVRFATYYDEYDVIQVNGDRVVIGIGNTVTAAVNAVNIAKDEEIAEAPADAEVPTDIPTQEETENAHGFKVGQKVKVINAYDYYGNMFKCWYSKYDVIEVKNDRIVIGIGNTVTAAVNAANLAVA